MEKIEEKIKQLKIVYPDLEEMPDDIYANNVRVSYNMYDFVLYFGKIDTPPILEGEVYTKDEIKAKVVARIRLTPKVAEGLSSALKQNIEAFSEDKEKG
ncbi:MAG: DUF3467 domain-containing protein [Actinobacteria bacterium]|nr:DUF3467 domain-containing protein [Actinomycetota bacterium]MCG2790119.1 DUF3467 domain-containing protein [Actinomycetes bacterium]